MESNFFNPNGDQVRADELRILKARDLALKMEAEIIAFTNLLECKKNGQTEKIIFDVDVEVPQVCQHPIRPSKRVAATFVDSDDNFRPPDLWDFNLIPKYHVSFIEVAQYPYIFNMLHLYGRTFS